MESHHNSRIQCSVAAYNVKNRVFTGLILHVEVSHQGSRNDWPSYTGFINHRYSRIFCKQMLVGIDIYIYLPSHPPLRQNILMVRPSHILHPSGPLPMLISLGLLINSRFFCHENFHFPPLASF